MRHQAQPIEDPSSVEDQDQLVIDLVDDDLILKMAIQGAQSFIILCQAKLNQRCQAHQPCQDLLPKKKYNLSPQGRQAIIKATERRWAEFHRQQQASKKKLKRKPTSLAPLSVSQSQEPLAQSSVA